ncbi:MAG: ATP-dependent helicase [Candidatus Eiseniibacteriota bacterium]
MIATDASAIFTGLNPPQREAVEHDGGPLLVLAGAGSGKTRVLTRRVAFLVAARGVFPGSILAVTFTNKAAGEMKDRIIGLVGEAGRNAWIGTFHSIGARLLRRESDRIGISRDFSIFDRDDSVSALRRVLAALGISPKENSPESLLSLVSRAKNEMKSPGDLEREARGPYDRLVAQVYANYEVSLREQNALDFDDLLVRPVQLLRDPDVRLRWSRLFRQVLVDEYQDTNRCQYEFLRSVTEEHRQLFVVGDDDQSIYRWRGADLSNILDFERDHPDARIVRLEQNYRSTSRILGAANSVIRKNVGRKGKELWTENGEGAPVLVLDVADEQDEAMAVLKTVKASIESESRTPSDFVVLYRTNSQSRVLENAFQLGGVPYQVVGGVRFYERREIKDVIAYLRVLANPGDDVAARRIVNTPARGIGKKSLEDLEQAARAAGVPILEAMRRAVDGRLPEVRPAVRAKLSELVRVLDDSAAQLATLPVAELTERLLEDIGYEEHLRQESDREAAARWDNVTELLAAMQEFADSRENGEASVAAFLQEVSLASEIDDWEEAAPRVTLMTLHNAKGLEFPWVFITGLEDGLFPHANSILEPEGIEEERRLFYVGLTRARERVVLLWAQARRRFGGFNLCAPSQFLEEIDPEFVERRSLAVRPATAYRKSFPPQPRSVRPSAPPPPTDFLPRYEDETQEVAALEPGMRVRHPSWGEAVIEAVEGRGERMKLTLRFRGGVLKKVLAVYAKLELLG